jgi:mannan endo-1,4-beta-mannosidase
MNMKNIFWATCLIIILGSCGKKKNEEPQPGGNSGGGNQLSESAKKVLNNLKLIAEDSSVLLGHQGTTTSGAEWRPVNGQPDKSDFEITSGKYPAVYGWDWGPRADDNTMNNEWVDYDDLVSHAMLATYRGAINTFSLHLYRVDNNGSSYDVTSNLVAKILPGGSHHNAYKAMLDNLIVYYKKLKDNTGNPVPFILRPFHEGNHNWFWWGTAACTDAQYKSIFRFTVEYMRGKGLNNMLVCYSPGYFQDKSTYNARYPGDDVVDILGFDGYYGNNDGHGTDWTTLKNHLVLLEALGKEKNKVIAWTETGELNIPTLTYFADLATAVKQSKVRLAYLMFWANYQTTEYYVPYSNSSATLKQNFKAFVDTEKYKAAGESGNLYQ